MKVRKKGLMLGLIDQFISTDRQCRQETEYTEKTEYDCFCHDPSHIRSDLEPHQDQCRKTGHCCKTTGKYRACGLFYRRHHSVLDILAFCSVFGKSVKKEDGIVHGNCKLQNTSRCIGNKGNLSKHQVCSSVQHDCDADRNHKKYWFKP